MNKSKEQNYNFSFTLARLHKNYPQKTAFGEEEMALTTKEKRLI